MLKLKGMVALDQLEVFNSLMTQMGFRLKNRKREYFSNEKNKYMDFCASSCKNKRCFRNLNNKFFKSLQKSETRFSFYDFSKDCRSYKE